MLCNLGCTFTLHGGSIRLLVWKPLLTLILLTELIRNIPFPSEKLCALPCPVSRGVLLQTKAVPLLQKTNVGGRDLSKMLNQKIEIPFKASRWLCARTGGQFAPLCLNSLRKEMTKHISKTNFFHPNIKTHGLHLDIMMTAWVDGML